MAAPVEGSKLNLASQVDCGTQMVLPSDENRGPSGPTEESSALPVPVSRPVWETILSVCRLMIVREPEKSFQPRAARYCPFGLIVLDTSRALLSRIRVPSGEIHWLVGSRMPFAYV